MKSLVIAAGAAIALIPLSAATGAVLTLGGPLSQNCYKAAVDRDDRASALEACTRSLSEEGLNTSDRVATYVNRGIIHMIRGNAASADADFDAALALNRNSPDPWLNKAFLRLREDKGAEALPLIEEGMKHQPRREALAYFARGVAYEDMGDLAKAYADLKRAHELEPSWSLPSEYLARYVLR